MKRTILAVLTLLLAARVNVRAQAEPEVIYGDDDRLDLYQVENTKVLSWAESTVGLFQSSDVTFTRVRSGFSFKKKKANLRTEPYGPGYNLCKDEPFYEQDSGAFCSGSLIAPDILMTAGHCVVSESACKNTKFVFGFSIKKKGQSPKTVDAGEVYGCQALLGREQVNSGQDWALVRLDRPVADHKPLAVNLGGAVTNGTPLFVIGHPAGLPTKVAGGAKVRDASPEGYFIANLDTYGGNSGSAVFNGKSGQVEGILVRGETDYVYRGNCKVSNVCPDEGCRGEDVTKMSSVLPHIPPQGPATIASRVVPIAPQLQALLLKVSEKAGFDTPQ